MGSRPPIDRVRDREQSARENFRDDRETMTQKDAKLDREASEGAPQPEGEEQFEERMREQLKNTDDTDDE